MFPEGNLNSGHRRQNKEKDLFSGNEPVVVQKYFGSMSFKQSLLVGQNRHVPSLTLDFTSGKSLQTSLNLTVSDG